MADGIQMKAQAIAVAVPADIEAELAAARLPFAKAFAKWVRNQPLGAASGVAVIIMILIALFAAQLAPYDPVEANYGDMTAPPSADTTNSAANQRGPITRSRIHPASRRATQLPMR